MNEVPPVVIKLNAESPESKQITDTVTYEKFRHKDPKLPTLNSVAYQYTTKHGKREGLPTFITTGEIPEPQPEFYSFEEIFPAVARLNSKSPESEQIISEDTYEEFRHEDQKLPPFSTIRSQHYSKYGHWRGVIQLILTGKHPEPESELYSFEEIFPAVIRLNAESPESKQITDTATYEKFHHKDPQLPTLNRVAYQFAQKHDGKIKGLAEFFRNRIGKSKTKPYSFEEIFPAVARLNSKSPESEQITDTATYEKFRHKDPKLPTLNSVKYQFAQKHDGKIKGLAEFFRNRIGKSKTKPYSFEEIFPAVARLNSKSPESEQITDTATYEKFRHKDPKLPILNNVKYQFAQKHDGKTTGFAEFFRNRIGRKLYSLEEIHPAVARLNTQSTEADQIRGGRTYEEFRHNDYRLPSTAILTRLLIEKYGYAKGLPQFILTGTMPDLKPEFYPWEEVPSIVFRLNAESPETEQITDTATYAEFRHKDPKLPPWYTFLRRYAQKHGNTKGATTLVFGQSCEKQMSNL